MHKRKIISVVASLILIGAPLLLQAAQISPNPNPAGSTLDIINDPFAVNNANPYNNGGTINIDAASTLTNSVGASLHNFDLTTNVGGTLNNTGTLNNLAGASINNTGGTLNNTGTLNNGGGLTSSQGGSISSGLTTLNNTGTLNNLAGASISSVTGTMTNAVGGTVNNYGGSCFSCSAGTGGLLTNAGTWNNFAGPGSPMASLLAT